jgi:hypothetical protein
MLRSVCRRPYQPRRNRPHGEGGDRPGVVPPPAGSSPGRDARPHRDESGEVREFVDTRQPRRHLVSPARRAWPAKSDSPPPRLRPAPGGLRPRAARGDRRLPNITWQPARRGGEMAGPITRPRRRNRPVMPCHARTRFTVATLRRHPFSHEYQRRTRFVADGRRGAALRRTAHPHPAPARRQAPPRPPARGRHPSEHRHVVPHSHESTSDDAGLAVGPEPLAEGG